MASNEIVIVKRANNAPEKSASQSRLVQLGEIEQPEQPAPIVHLESLAEPAREESVYGSGWSITELMHEFTERASG